MVETELEKIEDNYANVNHLSKQAIQKQDSKGNDRRKKRTQKLRKLKNSDSGKNTITSKLEVDTLWKEKEVGGKRIKKKEKLSKHTGIQITMTRNGRMSKTD